MSKSDRYCLTCGVVGTPKKRVKGSFLTELFLWLCFLIPVDSPRAQARGVVPPVHNK